MALSNIFREPRREITEHAVGMLAIVGCVALDYVIVSCLPSFFNATAGDFAFSMFFFGFGLLLGFVIFFFIVHEIGEAICNAMARGGYDPRPRRRY